MLNNRKIRLIISLVIAIGLWMYVVGQMDPDTNKTFRNIPITYANSQTLEDADLAIASIDVTTVTVRVTGRRSSVGRLTKGDIKARVDLANAGAGKNELRIEITAPNGIEVVSQDKSKATLIVERIVTEERGITVAYDGSSEGGEEAVTVAVDPSAVMVSGASSQVEKVATVRADVKTEDVSPEDNTVTAKLTPVDEDGKTVENITLSQDTVTVTSTLYSTKTVNLTLTVTDNSSDGLERTYNAPTSVSIRGRVSALSEIESVSAAEIDISSLTESTRLNVEVSLPSGITLAQNSKPVLEVTVKDPRVSKEFALTSGDITLINLRDDKTATVSLMEGDAVTVTIKGTQEQVDAVSASDIVLSADLTGLYSGTHSVELKASAPEGITSIEVSPKSLNVTLKDKAGTE